MNSRRHMRANGENHAHNWSEGENDHKPFKPQFVLLSCVSALFAFSLSFSAGYALSALLFRWVGRPSELLAHCISGILGLCIFILGAAIFRMFYVLRKPREGHNHYNILDQSALLSSAVDAMNRMARGDFNVSVPLVENAPFNAQNNPFNKLAESVNQMARELGTMEQLRQDFISNVSHEIQSPLTSISGFATLLKNGDLTDELRAHYIDIIETESGRLSKLSENLLKLSALESEATPLAPHEYRIDKQITSAVLMLEPQWIAKGLIPDISIEKTLFYGDEELMNQVWINLLHNAIKFTPPNGSFGVSLRAEEGQLHCVVSDTGIGIPEADRIHIFERFYKADKSRDRSLGGNGLGLSLVKKIVELHDGRIELTNSTVGTTFLITLPTACSTSS